MTLAPMAILSNPQSGWNKHHLARLEGLAAYQGIPHHATPYEAIPAVLAACAQAGVRLLIVNGGDGTLDRVMTLLREASPFATEPTLAILAGGTSNMSQRDLGVAGHPAKALLRLIEAIEGGTARVTLRPPLKLVSEGDAPLYGFFLGMAALPAAIRFARARFHTRGLSGPFGELLVLFTLLFRLLTGRVESDPILAPRHIVIEDGEIREFACVCGFVTTLDRLLLGLRPVAPENRLGVFMLSRPYRRIGRLIGRFLRRRPALPGDGVTVFRAEKMTLRLDSPYVLDGELFDPATEVRLSLSLGAPFRFVRP